METAKQLLALLGSRNIELYLDQGKLKTKAAPGAISDDLGAQIKAHRDDLIALLQAAAAASAGIPKAHGAEAVTSSQRRLWLSQKLSDAKAIYNVPLAVKLSGALDEAALARALRRVVERHQALRTRFVEHGGEVVARLGEADLELGRHSVAAQDDEALRRKVAELAAHPFDLSRELLFRADLIRIDADRRDATEHVLVLCMHHIAADGWSCAILVKELEALYNAADSDAALPELPVQFADYAHWLQAPKQQHSEAAHLEYWRGQLRDLPAVHALPLDHPRPRVQSYEGAELDHTLPEALTAAARAFAARQGTTMYCLLQAALALVLARWSNEKDILIGTSSSGRIHPQLEHLVGFFVNPLILRNRIGEDDTVAGYLAATQRTLLEAFEHQQVAFERIADEVLPARSSSHAPIFQFMFDYQGAGAGNGRVALNGLDCALLPIASPGAKYDIEITATELPARLYLRWVYAAKLFGEATVRRLQQSFETLLAAFVAAPQERIAALPFLPADEAAFVARAALGPRTEVAPQTLPERFAEVARCLPDAVAVEFQGDCYSYGEIESRANKLAQFLRKLGLRAGGRAAVYLEPGPELVIAILAVLKAGGAYVPIDPAYPEDRVEYILEDADTQIVLCSREAMNEGLPVEQKIVPVDLEVQDALFASQPDEAPQWDAGETPTIAYVLYTSGSTGKPKGAVIGHVALNNYLDHAAGYFRDDLRGAVVSSSIGFDATITSLLTPLLLGQRVLLLESGLDAVFGGLKQQLLQDPHAWLFKITPAHLSALGHECAGLGPRDTRHVLIIGGEQLDYATVEQWRSRWLPQARYVNEYGPTETVVGCSVFAIDADSGTLPASGAVPIGKPIANTGMYAVNDGRLAPVGAVGELYIAGAGLAEGYLNLPEISAQRFVSLPAVDPQQRFYRTGDLVRLRGDGDFEFIKRCDDQVKIRGYRIEIGEIESALRAVAGVREAAVVVQEDAAQRMLAAFLQPADEVADAKAFQQRVRQELAKALPEYMVPAAFELIASMPLTVNGKVDKAALPKIDVAASLDLNYAAPQSELEGALCALWQGALGLERVGIHDNFLDIGGNSLMFVRLRAEIETRFGCKLDITAFFEYPTIAELARHLQQARSAAAADADAGADGAPAKPAALVRPHAPVAVIAMAGRFPDADSPDALWDNLREGREALRTFNADELIGNGFSAGVVANPAFVASAALLDEVERFDAEFFRMTPREAEVLDPQQRLLLECSVQALESAGYGDGARPRRCGVFLGCGESTYLANHLLANMALLRDLGLNVLHANSNHYLATRIAYKLDLTGPAVNIATACSTSLVAVHEAVASLRAGECELALAGGAGVSEFGPSGYLYQEGGIESPDGRCRAFDAAARGTRGGNGAGVVALKRLDDALRDGDNVLAVIRGSAINNDGSQKAGYTAPSVVGQAGVIEAALRDAGLEARQVQYVETHGTGTPLGDPIEFRALRKVFHAAPAQSCALGTLKPNIGHLDAAAGVAGLIKAVQALRHATLPPCLHFEQPNELIEVADSPFYFNRQATPWTTDDGEPRRAGVSAFGIGGTNVHVVLEQAPAVAVEADAQAGYRLIPLSAKSEASLAAAAIVLREHVQREPQQALADIAFTLQSGREAYAWRTFAVADGHDALAQALADTAQRKPRHHDDGRTRLATVFLFPGQGAQYAGMGLGLLGVAPRYSEAFERCRALIARHAGFDLGEKLAAGDDALLPTQVAQPALFALGYSLATELIGLGIEPEAMIGHSLGEFVAACVAGVFSLEDAVKLVCARAQLMQAGAPGAMLAVSARRDEAERCYDAASVALAAVNGPQNYVVSGADEAIARVEASLAEAGIECRRLQTSHAFHSPMMAAAADGLREAFAGVRLNPPQRRFVSNVSGAFISAEQACDPEYWVGHLLAPVQFARGLESLCAALAAPDVELAFVELGPGQGLTQLVRRNPCAANALATPSLRHRHESGDDAYYWLSALGRLWSAGAALDWRALQGEGARRRVALPTYRFERKRFWIERPKAGERRAPLAPTAVSDDPQDWFYLPNWQLAPAIAEPVEAPGEAAAASSWLVLADELGIAQALAERIRPHGEPLLLCADGDAPPAQIDDDARLQALASQLAGHACVSIACLWPLGAPEQAHDYAEFERRQQRSFYPLLKLLKAIFERCPRLEVRLYAVTDRALRVTGVEAIQAASATLRGLCKVAAQENPQIVCRLIDIDLGAAPAQLADLAATAQRERIAEQLWREFNAAQDAPEVALRGNGRWLKQYLPLAGSRWATPRQRLRPRGHYLITGGLGRIGLQLATWLGSEFHARISLLSRREFPPQQEWARVEDGAFGADIAEQVRCLNALRAAGAEVEVLRADVADAAALAAAVDAAEQRFGALAGVFHAAGNVEDSVLPLAATDEAACRRQFASKAAGLIHLESALRGRTPDFCLVMSSLAAELGGLGFTAYAAANAYADAFVQRMRNDGHDFWCAIDWDGWNFSASAGAHGIEHAMRPADGMRAFAVAMQHCDQPCLINSTTDLDARFARWVGGLGEQGADAAQAHERPQLSQQYAAPSSKTEEAVARLWQDVLGIEGIGAHDSFFELGGDSLIATRLVAKVRTHFNVADRVFSLSDFFAQPTVAHTAARIDGLSVAAKLASKREELRAEAVVEEGEF
ncbi:hybrid non-ribosomal peptide synthetase/type I polyketide synthase [Lysobacter enzymogenes]|uniref:NRPS/PKS hybrid synthase n=2 Tax=Bacteria TaxID=2 RepID=A0AAU9AQ46_LYSEN|nr:hybrid non-ribosomal peptide synthetase/type I polyketide synthase [Lysobacter enzymogenes]BAV99523.1 NRPS/PKS hybrid synthase [Lysobacter enzymogenes]